MPVSPDGAFFADGLGDLGNHLIAPDDDLNSSDLQARFSPFVGDVPGLTGHAQGGDDVMLVVSPDTTAIGDALTISQHAQGGNDAISVDLSGPFVMQGFGDADTLAGSAHGGDDTIDAIGGFAMAVGDALLVTDHAQGGDDHLTGHTAFRGGSAILLGDASTLSAHARGGDDTLTGYDTFSADMYGDARLLADHAHGGDDLLIGGAHVGPDPHFPNNKMFGDGEQLLGNAQGGSDTLVSGQSSYDLMWGDAATVGPDAHTGNDLFVFAAPSGHDQIMDFEPGKDRIELDGFGSSGFQQLVALFKTTADGALISFDANDDVLVRGVSVSQLSASDFVFG